MKETLILAADDCLRRCSFLGCFYLDFSLGHMKPTTSLKETNGLYSPYKLQDRSYSKDAIAEQARRQGTCLFIIKLVMVIYQNKLLISSGIKK